MKGRVGILQGGGRGKGQYLVQSFTYIPNFQKNNYSQSLVHVTFDNRVAFYVFRSCSMPNILRATPEQCFKFQK